LHFLAAIIFLWPVACQTAQPDESVALPLAAPLAADLQNPPEGAQPPESTAPAPSQPNRIPLSKQQTKRILGVMPNYRAVSAGAIPPPPTPKQAFMTATLNSFDYSAFVFAGVTSFDAWITDKHPQLRSGIAGYGRYYWRGFLDRTDGNYLVIFALPTLFRQDERYYSLGEGSIWKRGVYAASRTLITPNYHGHPSFNASELLGRALAQAISTTYYPSQSRSLGDVAVRFGNAVGRDTLTNVFREFWPDINAHVLHRHKG